MSDGEEDEAGVADGNNAGAMPLLQALPLSPRLALMRWHQPWHQPLQGGPRPKTHVVHGNEYTGLLNAVQCECAGIFARII